MKFLILISVSVLVLFTVISKAQISHPRYYDSDLEEPRINHRQRQHRPRERQHRPIDYQPEENFNHHPGHYEDAGFGLEREPKRHYRPHEYYYDNDHNNRRHNRNRNEEASRHQYDEDATGDDFASKNQSSASFRRNSGVHNFFSNVKDLLTGQRFEKHESEQEYEPERLTVESEENVVTTKSTVTTTTKPTTAGGSVTVIPVTTADPTGVTRYLAIPALSLSATVTGALDGVPASYKTTEPMVFNYKTGLDAAKFLKEVYYDLNDEQDSSYEAILRDRRIIVTLRYWNAIADLLEDYSVDVSKESTTSSYKFGTTIHKATIHSQNFQFHVSLSPIVIVYVISGRIAAENTGEPLSLMLDGDQLQHLFNNTNLKNDGELKMKLYVDSPSANSELFTFRNWYYFQDFVTTTQKKSGNKVSFRRGGRKGHSRRGNRHSQRLRKERASFEDY